MWPWRAKMPTQNLLRLLLLQMLMTKILLATVYCIFGGCGLVIKLNFCSDFEHKIWSWFWSWSLGNPSSLLFSFLDSFTIIIGKWFLTKFQLQFSSDPSPIIGYPCLDKAPRLSISVVIWILSSDTICQINQFNTNSEAAMLSTKHGCLYIH